MFKAGEYVVYKRDVCKIVEIKKNQINNTDYYIMVPINDDSLKINVPIENKLGNIRPLLNKEQVKLLIHNIPNIKTIDSQNKLIENAYRDLIHDNTHEGLIKIIKTAYLRNKERLDNKRKIGDKDDCYFKLAETYLYNELAIVLNMSFEQTKEYIIKEVEKLI
ncbi:MAG: hypothetical protein E7165_03980 [Firmicutes bacterium]|nr:hypothetical protein [Bacillota bacterium]